jgi:hypothetical protein
LDRREVKRWRKLLNVKLHNLYIFVAKYNYNDQVKEDDMGSASNTNGKNAFRILVGKPEGKRPLGRPSRKWVNNTENDLREIGWGRMDWFDLAECRDQWRALVKTVMNLRVP